MREVHVDKADLTKTHIAKGELGDLADEAVRLGIESFSVTANNVTYAVVGDGFGYWNSSPPRTATVSCRCGVTRGSSKAIIPISPRASGFMAICPWARISTSCPVRFHPAASPTWPHIASR